MKAIDSDLLKSVCGRAATVFSCKLVFLNQPSLNSRTYVAQMTFSGKPMG